MLEEFSPEEQNDVEVRSKIFEKVVGPMGMVEPCVWVPVLGALLSAQELNLCQIKI